MSDACKLAVLALGVTLVAACKPSAFEIGPSQPQMSVASASSAGRRAREPAAAGGGRESQPSAAGNSGGAGGTPANVDHDAAVAPMDPEPEDDAGKSMSEPVDAGPRAMMPLDAGPAPCPEPCVAAHASGTCVAGACRFSCTTGYGDCDGDLARGSQGSGCEAALALDVSHCGQCNDFCSAPSAGYTTCDSARCVDHVFQFDAPTPGRSHGTTSMLSMAQLCPEGMVVTGFEGFVEDSTIADSIRLHCSALALVLSASQPDVTVAEPTTPLPLIGANSWETVAMTHTPYALQCAPGEVARDVQLTVWSHWGDAQGVAYPTIKDFALRCAKPRVDNGQLLLGAAGAMLVTGVTQQQEQGGLEQDSCGDNALLRGFALSSGTNIDQVALLCAQIHVTADAQ